MSEKGNLRRHHRAQSRSIVQIGWKDQLGNEKYTKARILDISEAGMRVEVPERIPERSYVTLRADDLSLQGRGSVRTCHAKGIKYIVGVEFSAGMKWKPKTVKSEPAESVDAEVETQTVSR